MSADFFRRVPVESLAQQAAWYDKRDLNRFLWNKITAGNGLNKVEREQARELVRKRIAHIRATSQPQQQPTAAHPTSPFSGSQLSAAVREIEFQVDRKRTQARLGDLVPYGCDFSAAAIWLLDQLKRQSCLKSIACPPDAEICHRCQWIYLLHSRVGRQESEGTMLQVQRDLGLLSFL